MHTLRSKMEVWIKWTHFWKGTSEKCFSHSPVLGSIALKAGAHRPNRWTSEAFVETWTRSGTNLFGVFSYVWSFWSFTNVVCSDSTCEVWEGWLSAIWAIGFSDWLYASCMTILIGGVLANQRGVWEGWNTVCVLFFYALHSVIPCFHVLENWHETSCYNIRSGRINLCLFGNALLHVWYAAVFVWNI